MRSKGQIALYMIIGMVVLIGVGVFIYSTTSAGDEESYQFIDMPFEVQPLKNLVDGCLDEAIDKGVYYSAMLGGRIYDTSLRLNTDREELNYYYVEGILTTPPKVEITSDLAFFIQNEVGFCLERRKEAGEVSYNFTMGEAEGEVYIEDEEIVVIIDPKVKIFYNNNENRFTLPKYYKKVGYRLGYIHGIAVDFAQGLLDDNNRLSLQLPDDEHLNAKVMIYSDNTVIFTIADENVPRGNTPLVFSFIIQHSATPTPELVYIPDWKLEQGREFAYQVEMEKFEGNVFFYTNDPLVPIDSQTGLINFTPQFAGEFAIRVGVESFAGKNDEQQVKFMVEPHKANFEIEPIGEIYVPVRKSYIYTIEIRNPPEDGLTFSVNNPLFSINEEKGTLIFTPLVVGETEATVTARDSFGNVDTEDLLFHVVSANLPKITPIPRLTATLGERFTYQVDVENPDPTDLTYEDDSDLFDIDANGLISFVPNAIETHNVVVTVKNVFGDSVTEEFEIVVENG